MTAADPDAAPFAGMRYRVWREMDDPTRPYLQERFYVQTATLTDAVQVECLLSDYDQWLERSADHDIDVWDGTDWADGLDPDDEAAAEALARRLHDLNPTAPSRAQP